MSNILNKKLSFEEIKDILNKYTSIKLEIRNGKIGRFIITNTNKQIHNGYLFTYSESEFIEGVEEFNTLEKIIDFIISNSIEVGKSQLKADIKALLK